MNPFWAIPHCSTVAWQLCTLLGCSLDKAGPCGGGKSAAARRFAALLFEACVGGGNAVKHIDPGQSVILGGLDDP